MFDWCVVNTNLICFKSLTIEITYDKIIIALNVISECYGSVMLYQSIISSVAEHLIPVVEAVTGGMLSMTIMTGSQTRIISVKFLYATLP